MHEDLIDRIYEAAFLPELWPDVLTRIGAVSQSLGGILFTTGPRYPARWTASSELRELFDAFATDAAAPSNDRPSHFLARRHGGFLRDVDFLSPHHLEREPLQRWLAINGLGREVGTVFSMPNGETVVIGLERRFSDGPYPASVLDPLDHLRPHLARSAFVAARLGLERAQTTVATLDAIGVPAAVLDATGRVLAVNTLLEKLPAMFLPAVSGRLALADRAADALFRAAAAAPSPGRGAGAVRSIRVRGREEQGATVIHVLPLVGRAHEVFSGATTLVVATAIGMGERVPTSAVLQALFDLSPAEARLAIELASGRALKEAADNLGIRLSTARSYLEQVFHKTRTRQQSQLVALLKGVQTLPGS